MRKKRQIQRIFYTLSSQNTCTLPLYKEYRIFDHKRRRKQSFQDSIKYSNRGESIICQGKYWRAYSRIKYNIYYRWQKGYNEQSDILKHFSNITFTYRIYKSLDDVNTYDRKKVCEKYIVVGRAIKKFGLYNICQNY